MILKKTMLTAMLFIALNVQARQQTCHTVQPQDFKHDKNIVAVFKKVFKRTHPHNRLIQAILNNNIAAVKRATINQRQINKDLSFVSCNYGKTAQVCKTEFNQILKLNSLLSFCHSRGNKKANNASVISMRYLALALLKYSATKNQKEKQKSLAIIKVLLSKGANPRKEVVTGDEDKTGGVGSKESILQLVEGSDQFKKDVVHLIKSYNKKNK